MAWFRYYWSDDTIDKLGQHGLTVDDFEFAFEHYHREVRSNSSARLIRFGGTIDGRAIAAVFQWDEPNVTVIPITAYEVREL